jgi:sulfite reductase (ferredoxin)
MIESMNSQISTEDQKDISELQENIGLFQKGLVDEEKFKLYRLTRGVYGQRQIGVQMFRIKIPYGKLNTEQLVRIADVSDKYSNGNLHLTTRQDIQLHHVKLDHTPKVWTELAEKKITAREACGNTVRNVTASEIAGIDPREPFDVTPHAHAVAYYFMRNPICQEMGRKIKIAFSSSRLDNALTFMHDFGFVPIRSQGKRGFAVYVGGGLGAQAMFAQKAFDFLPEEKIIPFLEAALRVFDRYGEREKRHKARLKFLIKSIGLDEFLSLVNSEMNGLTRNAHPLSFSPFEVIPAKDFTPRILVPSEVDKFKLWRKTNVIAQSQKGFYAVYVKIKLGDLSAERARYLSKIVKKYAADDIRLTINQNLLIKYVREAHLPELFTVLNGYGFAEPGYDSVADITACPGTDTCNLGVTNSTQLALEIEHLIEADFPDLIEEKNIKIKISGCMNACGQHMIANIGLHGSSIKKNNLVIPAMQVVIGGGVDPEGRPYIADKVIKIPTKRVLIAISSILEYFLQHSIEGEYFNAFYKRVGGKKFFYDLLKPFASIDTIQSSDLIDWGHEAMYEQAIGVGECAGVILDLVGTILKDASAKAENAQYSFNQGAYGDSIYHAYSSFIIGAKALLLSEDVKCNTHRKIISDFQSHFILSGKLSLGFEYEDTVLTMKNRAPSMEFARQYVTLSTQFIARVKDYRRSADNGKNKEKEVVESYYKA